MSMMGILKKQCGLKPELQAEGPVKKQKMQNVEAQVPIWPLLCYSSYQGQKWQVIAGKCCRKIGKQNLKLAY